MRESFTGFAKQGYICPTFNHIAIQPELIRVLFTSKQNELNSCKNYHGCTGHFLGEGGG